MKAEAARRVVAISPDLGCLRLFVEREAQRRLERRASSVVRWRRSLVGRPNPPPATSSGEIAPSRLTPFFSRRIGMKAFNAHMTAITAVIFAISIAPLLYCERDPRIRSLNGRFHHPGLPPRSGNAVNRG